MCGIVGLFLKDKALEPKLGELLTDMLITMTDRGPDSAGIAIYSGEGDGLIKITVQSANPDKDFKTLDAELKEAIGQPVAMKIKSTHAVLEVPAEQVEAARSALAHLRPQMKVMSVGDSLEIYKEVGLPKDVAARFEVSKMKGSHGIGHTRMATESAVTTMGAHPFSTGPDQCLVHNGSLSNHNGLRRMLRREGIRFQTENDTEVAAGYMMWRQREGDSMQAMMDNAFEDLDGFYTFLIGTRDGFAVVRDPIACKPAVIAETDEWVAMSSEYRSIATLPGAEKAQTWEPAPATIYAWEKEKV